MSKHKLQQSDPAQATRSLAHAQRVSLLAQLAEVILSDFGQAHAQTEPETDIIYIPNLLRSQHLDAQEHTTGSSSHGLPAAASQLLPPEAQALRQVTMRQAAEILGVHERTIRRLLQAGELSAVGRGRLTRIALRDIAAYQQRNRR